MDRHAADKALSAEFAEAGLFADAGLFAEAGLFGEFALSGEAGLSADSFAVGPSCDEVGWVDSTTAVSGRSPAFSAGTATADPAPSPRAASVPTAIHFFRSTFMTSSFIFRSDGGFLFPDNT